MLRIRDVYRGSGATRAKFWSFYVFLIFVTKEWSFFGHLFVEHQVGSLKVGVCCAYRAGVQLHVTISVGFELEQQTLPSPNCV